MLCFSLSRGGRPPFFSQDVFFAFFATEQPSSDGLSLIFPLRLKGTVFLFPPFIIIKCVVFSPFVPWQTSRQRLFPPSFLPFDSHRKATFRLRKESSSSEYFEHSSFPPPFSPERRNRLSLFALLGKDTKLLRICFFRLVRRFFFVGDTASMSLSFSLFFFPPSRQE